MPCERTLPRDARQDARQLRSRVLRAQPMHEYAIASALLRLEGHATREARTLRRRIDLARSMAQVKPMENVKLVAWVAVVFLLLALFAAAAQTFWTAQPLAILVLPVPFALMLVILVVVSDRWSRHAP